MKALRRQRGLSQDGMARLFGFKDRQIVSAIETGVRRVTATELLLAVEKLKRAAGLFHRSVPAGRRGIVLVAPAGCRQVAAHRLRAHGQPLDRCIPGARGRRSADGGR